MTMRNRPRSNEPSNRSSLRTVAGAAIRTPLLRLVLAGLLGVAAALLVSCGSSSNGLIPAGNAGPLQSDFEEVALAVQNGNGSCAATAAAIRKTEQDSSALPSTIDPGLRSRLSQGIANLRTRALVLCAQPHPQATSTSTSPRTPRSTPTTSTTPTVTQTTNTQTTPARTTPTTSSSGGGTPAPGAAGGEASPGAGSGQGGGTSAGEGASGGAGLGAGKGNGQ